MPVTLRRRLICHFCGQRTSQTHLRTFRCEHCEAVNHLDENGDITDPPASSTATSTQYADPRPFQTNSIFCQTCIKNQSMVTRLLAEFVPDEDDPGYRKALTALPAYQERLHRDYPQCCAKCEPRARSQMAAATKAAAADNMRLQIQRSRLKRAASMIDLRTILVESAGLGYFTSIIGELAWHYFGAQVPSGSQYRGPAHCFSEWPAPRRCQEVAQSWAAYTLILAVLCVWWNPGWGPKLRAREGRLVGLGRYYALQVAILTLRSGSWFVLQNTNIAHQQRMMSHSILLIVLAVLTAYGISIVHLNTTPLINWSYEPPRLVSESQYVPPPTPQVPALPINQFASTQAQNIRPWQPPTPPVEEDQDAMDWTPSQIFQPTRRQPARAPDPSPFFGTLPALPGGMQRIAPKPAIGLPPGLFDNRAPLLPEARRRSIPAAMADPSFFPTAVDTGLENLFGQVFSLGERRESSSLSRARSSVVQATQLPTSTTQQTPFATTDAVEQQGSGTVSIPATFSFITSLLVLGVWIVSERLLIAFPNLRLLVLLSAALVPLARLFLEGALWSGVYAANLVLLCTAMAMNMVSADVAFMAGAFLLAQDIISGARMLFVHRREVSA